MEIPPLLGTFQRNYLHSSEDDNNFEIKTNFPTILSDIIGMIWDTNTVVQDAGENAIVKGFVFSKVSQRISMLLWFLMHLQ